MGFYFFIFVILALCTYFELFGLKKRDSRLLFIIFSFAFFILSFIRWETGTDWGPYYNYFNTFTDWDETIDFEPGYLIINNIGKYLFGSYTMVLFICGAVLFYFQSSAILRYSPYPIMSLFFLWSIQFANILFVRQWIAVAILFYSVRYISEQKIYPFLLLVALATLFHKSALVFIPAWWIYRMKLKPWVMISVLSLTIGFSSLMEHLINGMSEAVGGGIQSRIDAYLSQGREMYGQKASFLLTLVKGLANKVLIFVAALIFLKKIEAKNPEFRGYLNLYWVGAVIYFAFITLSTAMVRFSYPFDMFQIILIPYIFSSLVNKPVKQLGFVLLVAYLALRLYTLISLGHYDSFVPFTTIFS